MTALRGSRLVAVVLAAALLVAGCATVPTKGPIRQGDQAGLAPEELGGVGVEAQKPRVNAAPLAIVNGFLEAMSDSRAFDVARQYMTPEAAAAWKPETKISVYDQASTKAVSVQPKGKVELNAPLIATIDERGSWTPAKRGGGVHFVFELAKIDGQWRVAVAPQGVFLGSNQLEPKLTPRPLYFFTPARDMLVPDTLYLPNNLPPGQVATMLIQQLLKGPTARLGNGVVSAAPPGTQVNVSVPVDLGVATVALSNAAAALGDQERTQLAAQILWTLYPISSKVRITVDGAPLLTRDPDILSFSSFSQFDPTPPSGQLRELYGVRNGKIQHIVGLDGSGPGPIESKPLDESELYGYNAESFAVNLGTDLGAIVTRKDGKHVVLYGRLAPKETDGKMVSIPTDGKVLRPTFDSQGNLWILDRADSSKPRLRMRSSDGQLTEVRTSFGGNTPVVLRLAPDGVRVLLVMRKKSGETFVQTGTIAVNEAKQSALGQFRSLELPLVDITDAAWNQTGILVAGKSATGATRQPWQVNTDGSQPRLIPGANFEALAVASNPNSDTLPAVQDVQGQLHWQAKDLSWPGMGEEAQGARIDPVYPG